MSIKRIFKDGRAELKRKSRLRGSKKNLVEKEKTYEVKLTALGKKARDAKLDISQFGDLSGTLSQIEGKGKEIGVKLNELIKQTAELEGKKKAENARFNALWKDLETKKKPVESELKSEKDKLEKAQKETDSIQKRLKNIPDEEKKIGKKITESPGNAQSQAELEKKLAALKEEQKQLDPKLPDLTKIIQAAKEKITPLDQQSGRLEAEMKKAKDQHKKENEEIDKTLSKVKGEINEFNKQQKAVSGQQVQNFQALGKKLSEANVADPAIAVEMDAVKAGEKEMASIRAAIQSLESLKAPGARGAVWKMAGLILVFVIMILGIIISVVILSKSLMGRKSDEIKSAKIGAPLGKPLFAESEAVKAKAPEKEIYTSGTSQTTTELSQEEIHRASIELDKMLDTLKRQADTIHRDTFDPHTLIGKIGKDPERLFEWVRDYTNLAPYRGSLRGAVGVLMDRIGNSIDRSILLATLLESAGHKARLAHATLTENLVQGMLSKARPIPARGMQSDPRPDESERSGLEGAAERLGIDPADFRRDAELIDRSRREATEEGTRRIAVYKALLLESLRDLPAKAKAEHDQAAAAFRDHWWVQMEQSGGSWIDLDPALPDSRLGIALSAADQTWTLDDLPNSLFHEVRLRVIIERSSASQMAKETVLDHGLIPARLHGVDISVIHIPVNHTENFPRVDGEEARGWLQETALKEKEWLPVLVIDKEAVAQASFTVSGTVNKQPGRKEGPSGLGGAARGILDAFGGGSETRASDAESVLTAEWLEYEIREPGRPPKSVRRELFDLVGPARRAAGKITKLEVSDAVRRERGLSFLGNVEIMFQVSAISEDFAEWHINQRLMEQMRVFKARLEAGDQQSAETIRFAFASLLGSARAPALVWGLLRRELNDRVVPVYVDSVNIVNVRSGLVSVPPDDMFVQEAFDIVTNQIAIAAPSAGLAADARLTQGVADTVAEGFVFGGLAPERWADDVFAVGANFRSAWRLVRSLDDSPWIRNVATPDALARIQGDLEAGCAVVVLEKPILVAGRQRLGWWRLNLLDGETLGVLDSGLHGAQAAPEYSKMQKHIQEIMQYWVRNRPWRHWPSKWPAKINFKEFVELTDYAWFHFPSDIENLRRLYVLARTFGVFI